MLTFLIAHSPLFCIAHHAVLDTIPVNDLGLMNICCPSCNAIHWEDESVSSSRIGRPEFRMCCTHGKVTLPSLHVPPVPLYNLFTTGSPQGKEF